MDRDDPAYRGQADYSRPLLNLYDPLVLGPIARFVWGALRLDCWSDTGSASDGRTSMSVRARATSSIAPACRMAAR